MLCSNSRVEAALASSRAGDQLAIEQAPTIAVTFVLSALVAARRSRSKELGLDLLAQRLGDGEVQELIIATNPTVEGEATAHMLGQLARAASVRATRLAHGVPLGGELEFIDRGTLAHAFGGRQLLG